MSRAVVSERAVKRAVKGAVEGGFDVGEIIVDPRSGRIRLLLAGAKQIHDDDDLDAEIRELINEG